MQIIPTGKQLVHIDEERCIGCTLCIKACPFDAIIGAAKHMHTVILHYCTGCELCLPPCPVDCIEIQPNHLFIEVSNKLSISELRETKKSFATFSKKNKLQRKNRLKFIKEQKQKKFERRKAELLNRSN